MSVEKIEGVAPLVGHYADRLAEPPRALPPGLSRGSDELLQGGQVRPASALVLSALQRFGTIGLQSRQRVVERLVDDDGITYGGSHPGVTQRPWLLDVLPLVLDAPEWATLEAGLEQRARLLDALLADLVGPRRLLHDRILPAEVVTGHAGFLPAAHAVSLPTARQLTLVAVDLARDAAGHWLVLADRTQAPSGAGFAMANRRITARALEAVHRQANLRRLRGWFDVVQAALQAAAPPEVEDVPRVVLLTPGPGSETTYDQALLATLLGHPLAQSDDLVMRGGRLWLRTTGRLEAVDVVLRRVDADWADSLDLLPQSRLGVPGLVAAARRGTVSVVNPLPAGVLENPGLFPFLPAAARALLDEELSLDVPQTWWCGDAASRAHVLSHLDRLVIKPIYRGLGDTEVLGWIQSSEALDDLRRRIEARPWAWTGQEPVAPSTAPVVTRHGLEPRHVVLRTFGVALGESYHFLPGGLARVAPSIDSFVVTNHTGATSKDVWVLEAEGVAAVPRIAPELLARVRAVVESAQVPGLTPRAASDLFWLGRYAERAEAAARLLLVVDNLVEDHVRRSGTPGHAAMRDMLGAVTEVTAVRPGFTGEGAEERLAEPLPSLVRLLTDEHTPGTLAYNAQRAVGAAGDVRELLSQDTPGVLSRLQRTLAEARAEGADVSLQQMASRTLESLTALAGLTAESLIRDPTWAFLDAGRRVERAQVVVRLLRATLGRTRPPVAEALVVESVLRVGDSLITYRRRMAAGVGPTRPAAAALQLLLGEAHNPRSLLFQLERLRDDLAHAPAPRVSESLRALLGRVRDLEPAELGRGQRSHLVDTLTGLEADLRALSDEIAATHFTTQAPQRVFAVAELVREEP